jgi:hypothetical protein
VVLWVVGRDFFEFIAQWLYAHPCLRSEERRQLLRGMAYPGLDLLPAGLTLLVLFASHVFPPFPILVAVYSVLILFLLRGPLFDTGPSGSGLRLLPVLQSLNRYLAAYLSYGRRFQMPLPGVWNPKRTFRTRQRVAALTLLLLLFILGLGTKCFFAWDTPGFRASYESMFARSMYGDSSAWTALQKRMAGLDWSSIPSKAELDQMNRKLAGLQSQQRWGTLDQQIARDFEVNELQSRIARAPVMIRQVSELWFNQHANGWISVAFRNLATAPGPVLGSLAFAICNALLLPILLLLVANQRAFVALIRAERDLQARILKDADRNPWECYVDRLSNSPHKAEDAVQAGATVRESEHVFLGLEAEHGFPVLLHRPILEDHAYIAGGTGSGKTSLGILSLLVQLIRGGPADGADEGKMPPIVIIDLKGEHALLHSVREEVRKKAEQEGRTLQDCFRLFSCAKGMPTHYFNPISDMTHPDRYLADLTNLLLDALELNHGAGYGRSYYSRKNYMMLHDLLKSNDPKTFADLCEKIARSTHQNKDDRNQAFELMATLYGLMEFEQLKPPPDVPPEEMISMREVVENRQVVYFWLPTVESSIIAREIANLALFSYFSAMRMRSEKRAPKRQAYLVVDEFQKLAGARFGVILEMARGFGLSAILSNQCISDLRTRDHDLESSIKQNTRVKLFFSITDTREMTEFIKRSGEELAYTRSGVYDFTEDGQPDAPVYDQWRHDIKPRVMTNDILRVTDHPRQCFLDIRSGSGYTQFEGACIPLQMFHPINLADFQHRRDTAPWPSREELGLRASTDSTMCAKEVDERAASVLARLDEYIRVFDEKYPDLRYS